MAVCGLRFRLLGPVELVVGEQRGDLGPRQRRAVFAALLYDVGRPVSMETLIDRVWDEAPPAGVRAGLYAHIARLRATLRATVPAGQAELRLDRCGGYLLDTDPRQVDLHRFRALVREAATVGMGDVERAGLLRQALDLWQGTPLSGVPGCWADGVRQAIERTRLDAAVDWSAIQIRQGRPRAAIDELSGLAVAYPLAEDVTGVLMRALAAAGRPGEALARFADARRHLADLLGSPPGPELCGVYERIRRPARRGGRPIGGGRARVGTSARAGPVSRSVDLAGGGGGVSSDSSDSKHCGALAAGQLTAEIQSAFDAAGHGSRAAVPASRAVLLPG
jgi:DNA-binding SARP family transcriptional activator